jgi:hypothetical protein
MRFQGLDVWLRGGATPDSCDWFKQRSRAWPRRFGGIEISLIPQRFQRNFRRSSGFWLCLPQIKPEHIGDAVHPGSDGTECAPLSRRLVISARPCSTISECACHYSSPCKPAAHDADGARRTPRYDRGTPGGSSRSTALRRRFAGVCGSPLCRDLVLSVRTRRHDHQSIIRQWPLQYFRLIPRRTVSRRIRFHSRLAISID